MKESTKLKIFIVEDDFIFTNIMNDLVDGIRLKYEDYNIEITSKTYYSIKEAKYELSDKPDIVLLDYYIIDDDLLPVTGDALLEEIVQQDKNTKVIIVSGQEDRSTVDDLKKKGAAFYVDKSPKALPRLAPILSQIVEAKLTEEGNFEKV